MHNDRKIRKNVAVDKTKSAYVIYDWPPSELGWAALQLFDFERLLVQGTFLLNLWPPEAEKQVGPAPGL